MPSMIYGTAWKEERTKELVTAALEAGFKGIDTANQRRHYFEASVGDALKEAFERGLIKREDLFLQSKFTYKAGQDHRLPYDPMAPLRTQVRESLESSLEHLHSDYLDSYLLHGPSVFDENGEGVLLEADYEAWREMENLHRERKVLAIGVSNVSLSQLRNLWSFAKIKPSVVQNRCFARTKWDEGVRKFCKLHGVGYQGFSLLTANRNELSTPDFLSLVEEKGTTSARVVFRFAELIGITALTGTTDSEHMASDLACGDVDLSEKELDLILKVGQ